jgi:16S rRNA (adenine1518-N6/adenine1519-N6)-dimethyltransferase
VQSQARAERLFEVPKTSFRPPPKVDSAVVGLEPVDAPIENLPSFLKFAGNCFRYKRKTLCNNLAGLYDRFAIESLIGPKDRAEALSIAELAHLFGALTR